MYLRHFAFSRLPFADTIEADLMFASAACCWSASPSCAAGSESPNLTGSEPACSLSADVVSHDR